jgi:hypothetical protein
MFSFFERNTSFKFNQASSGDLSEPTGVAIVALMTAIEQRLEHTCHWTREAGNVLSKNDLEIADEFIHFAKRYAKEAVALMERLSVLHNMSLTGE